MWFCVGIQTKQHIFKYVVLRVLGARRIEVVRCLRSHAARTFARFNTLCCIYIIYLFLIFLFPIFLYICRDMIVRLRVSYLLTGHRIRFYSSLMILLIGVPSSLSWFLFYPRRSVSSRLFPQVVRMILGWRLVWSHSLLRSYVMIMVLTYLLVTDGVGLLGFGT